MKNILQQLEDLVINLNRKDEFWRARIKLSVYYVIGLSFILTILSLAIYWFFSERVNLESLFPYDVNFSEHINQEGYDGNQLIHELKEKLHNIIIWVDIIIIFISSFFAYFFAKKTLAPIEKTLVKHKQFSSDIAHELRTPLAVLKSGIEYTLLKERKINDYIELLKEQHGEIDYIIDVSNNLLESLVIQHKKIQKENYNISDLCEQQAVVMHQYFKQNNILFNKEINSNIFANIDNIKIKRVLYNILKNAVEYNKKNGSVSLSLFEEKNSILIKISDTGMGIIEKSLENIFNQFYKADNSRTKNNGAGLGLYMAKEIIESHKGTLNCESTYGTGSTFTIRLPKK